MHPAMDHDAHNANASSHSMEMRMPFVFSTDTKITIFFPGWTTSSITQYILTLVFLFVLAILNRFLGAFRFQLEQAWSNRESRLRKVEAEVSGNRPPKSKRNPLPVYTQVNESDDSVSAGREDSRRGFYAWKSSGPWGLRKDGTRALLEFGRAFIGYVLMLAVMSFNVGVFAAVLLGVLCGELGLGRFSQGMAGW
ncbi:unnamed protein product [Penicillium salamii]|uniref:Copper transport protein n=1 Tax=Penicillium salamii TaxID=1612424 RepID=A0A9W4IMN2_9EURO|nr:unnamed protein product [Penicillium salamii]CAG8011056.1 unnamed protein product [Penicillium salamii]CAG8068553.1 unnamed protein product [Penicillium salamii]CAG8252205.1 unnamed protein product [Penicillium salamii]CAG8311057.1 unnamed protein product [Penicillium salamii]